MNELIAFTAAAAISFWGSLQLGPVNVCVIQTALAQGRKQALAVAAGGAIPELFYASAAVYGAEILSRYQQLMDVLSWSIVILMLALGLFYFFKPYREIEINPSRGAGFAKGFALALFNPQLFPFWLGVLVYIQSFINLKDGTLFSPYIGFVAGTAVGAWLLLYTFAVLATSWKERLRRILHRNLNRAVGILFMALAAVEWIRRIFFD